MFVTYLICLYTYLCLDNIESNSNRQLITNNNDEEDEDSVLVADEENVYLQNLDKENSEGRYSMSNMNKIGAGRTMKRKQNSVLKNKQDFYNITDEKELLIKLRDAIEQQQELHSMKMKVADAEVKVVLLKLSMAEDKVKEQSEI